MKTILSSLLLILSLASIGQGFTVPYSEYITRSKKSVLPIVCANPSPQGLITSQGTCVQLGHNDLRFFVTCEHVIAVKDTLQKTIKYFDNVFVNMANIDSTTSLIRLKIDYVDEQNDFALLSITNTPENIQLASKLTGQYIQKSVWLNNDSYSEGDYILYIGYPMMKSISQKNYPISRIGIVAQKIDKQNNILIDGFAQHGHSGSPVFWIRPLGNNLAPSWEMKLIGITKSYPPELTEVYEQIGFKSTNQSALVNPGFTNVLKMSVIISAIEKVYKIEF
jgi:hypothetical protein